MGFGGTSATSFAGPPKSDSVGTHHVYLIPGMFGFGKLAGYDYFEHMERELGEHFESAGKRIHMVVVPTPPTSSIRRRAQVVAETVARTCREDPGPIHLVGHSTGGLDARLLASPSTDLHLDPSTTDWLPRLDSVVTINTPHYGTPLAQFFSTVSGTRMLYALSLLTFTTLRFGGPPLTIFSNLVASLGRFDDAVGADIQLLDRSTDLLLRFLGEKGRDEVRTWLEGIRYDQGGILQVTPECMDIFNAAAENAADVRYGSVVTAAPSPSPLGFAKRITSPTATLSAAVYSTLYSVSVREPQTYPYPAPQEHNLPALKVGLGVQPDGALTDGVVPSLSMPWGKVIWAGRGDHLDVVGHFDDNIYPAKHVDWLHSGAVYSRANFSSSMDAISQFLMNSSS